MEVLASFLVHNRSSAFAGGAIIGTLGGLIGLGGVEFRLPLLIGFLKYAALEAVIPNKAMSLVVVATALPFRTGTVPFANVTANWPIVANLLAGSLLSAWFGAGCATRLKSETLYKVIASILVAIAIVLVVRHGANAGHTPVDGNRPSCRGRSWRVLIGIVASLLVT